MSSTEPSFSIPQLKRRKPSLGPPLPPSPLLLVVDLVVVMRSGGLRGGKNGSGGDAVVLAPLSADTWATAVRRVPTATGKGWGEERREQIMGQPGVFGVGLDPKFRALFSNQPPLPPLPRCAVWCRDKNNVHVRV